MMRVKPQMQDAQVDLQVNLPLQHHVHHDILPATDLTLLYQENSTGGRSGNGAEDLLIFDAVMKQAMKWSNLRWRGKEDERKPCWEKGSVGPTRKSGGKKGSLWFSQITDQLEETMLNSKLFLAPNDYWNKTKLHHMNLKIIGFQNLLELTQDLVIILKDHEFLSKVSEEHHLGKVPPA
jgi:hypothetical protein